MLLTACFAACSEDGKDVSDNGIKVVSTDSTEIPALGGNGSATFDKPITSAYAKDAWLNVTTEGQTVKFSADKYTARESRNTQLVVKASAEDSTIVSIKQDGYIFNAESVKEITVISNPVDSLIPIVSTEKIAIKSAPSWIKATAKDEGIQLNITGNTTGALRTGVVTFGVGDYSGSITVNQKKVPAEFGIYILSAYSLDDNQEFTKPVQYQCKLGWNGLTLGFGTIPGKYNDDTMTFTFNQGGYIGEIPLQSGSKYYLYTRLISESGNINYDTSAYGTFTFSKTATGTYQAKFGGAYSAKEGVAGIVIGAFADKSFNDAVYKGGLEFLVEPTLRAYPTTTSTTSQRIIPKGTNAKASQTSLKNASKLNITKLHLTK